MKTAALKSKLCYLGILMSSLTAKANNGSSILAASLDGSSGNQIFLSAYPNPASEQIRLNVNGLNTEENAVVKVLDLQGMEILNQDLDKSDISTQIDLDLRSIKPGVYLGILQQGDKKSFFRFVKE